MLRIATVLLAACLLTSVAGAADAAHVGPGPVDGRYQPIPGLECIRWGGPNATGSYYKRPPGNPEVTARCLYEEWRRQTTFEDVWVATPEATAQLLAQPFRSMTWKGCGPYFDPLANWDRFVNGGQQCSFIGSGSVLTLDEQHVSSGPEIDDVHLTTFPTSYRSQRQRRR